MIQEFMEQLNRELNLAFVACANHPGSVTRRVDRFERLPKILDTLFSDNIQPLHYDAIKRWFNRQEAFRRALDKVLTEEMLTLATHEMGCLPDFPVFLGQLRHSKNIVKTLTKLEIDKNFLTRPNLTPQEIRAHMFFTRLAGELKEIAARLVPYEIGNVLAKSLDLDLVTHDGILKVCEDIVIEVVSERILELPPHVTVTEQLTCEIMKETMSEMASSRALGNTRLMALEEIDLWVDELANEYNNLSDLKTRLEAEHGCMISLSAKRVIKAKICEFEQRFSMPATTDGSEMGSPIAFEEDENRVSIKP